MKRSHHPTCLNVSFLGLALCMLVLVAAGPARAQDQPPQRVLRSYIPPEQLVSALPSTPFNVFVEYLNPIFSRVTGKLIIDPDSRADPIGISIASMHFMDAFELVLQYKNLRYRESDQYFIVEVAPREMQLVLDAPAATGQTAGPAASTMPATLGTREIQIHAILFELDRSRAQDIGLNWDVFLGNQEGGSSSGGGEASGGQTSSPKFFLKTDKLFDGISDIVTAPSQIDFANLKEFFRVAESNGAGETIASPSVSVQSAEKGRMQVGTDVPVQVRDFSGNTVTQFFSTGIIIDVTPTLIEEYVADTLGSPTLEFIHLDVRVEKSSSTPSVSGPVIDRSQANTQVLLLDNEQTVIGGLFTTTESVSRSGIPILKDLPGWFFGLRYIFGRTQRSQSQKELLIVIQANILEPLEVRAKGVFKENLLEIRRKQVEESLRRVNGDAAAERAKPNKYRQD